MNLIQEFKKEFKPSNLLPSITAGLIATIVTFSTVIPLAALIFSGNLSPFLAGGIGLMLFGAFVMAADECLVLIMFKFLKIKKLFIKLQN